MIHQHCSQTCVPSLRQEQEQLRIPGISLQTAQANELFLWLYNELHLEKNISDEMLMNCIMYAMREVSPRKLKNLTEALQHSIAESIAEQVAEMKKDKKLWKQLQTCSFDDASDNSKKRFWNGICAWFRKRMPENGNRKCPICWEINKGGELKKEQSISRCVICHTPIYTNKEWEYITQH